MEAQQPPMDLAPEIAATLALRRVGLAGLPEDRAESAARVLADAGMLSQTLTLMPLQPLLEHLDCLALQMPAPGFEAPPALRALHVPVLAIGPGAEILAGAAGAYGWADGFVDPGWTDPQLLLAVYQVLTRRRPGRNPRRNRPLVLLVDDDSGLAALVQGVLENQGLACRCAGDGVAALAAVRTLLPDVLVLDVNIPEMDGFEVLAAVRADAGLANLPVALLTACNDASHVEQGSRLGADDYIAKPVSPVTLSSRIKRLLRRHYGPPPDTEAGPVPAPEARPEPASGLLPQTERVRALRDEYLKHRQEEVGTLRTAAIAGDFETARRIGHQLRGSGGAYGFPELTRMGTAIEAAAGAKSAATLLGLLQDLRRHIWSAAQGVKE